MITQTVALIGLGRVSGSIGLAIQQSDLGLTIVGNDRNRKTAVEAKNKGIITTFTSRLAAAASAADIIIIDVPVEELESCLKIVGAEAREHTLVIDLSNIKSAGQDWADRYMVQGHYLGAKPVFAAGTLSDGRRGIEAAQADLFRNSIFCLMPSAKADPKAVETAVNLGRILGAKPFFIDAIEYDSLMQGIDTLPGLLSAALLRALTKSSGWRDILRFAGLEFAQATASIDSPDLAMLAMKNKEASLRWIDSLLEELEEVRQWISETDEERFTFMLEELSIERERWLHERQENEWSEVETPQMEGLGLASQLLGFNFRRSDKKSE
jgi:prephenate dehydrogenase